MTEENVSKILVIDDERSVRELIYDVLTIEGYLVTTVEDGVAALSKLQEDSYDLLITDLVMPNMGGEELLDWVWTNNLNITALIMTGSPIKREAEYLKDTGAFALIRKPFGLHQLADVVEKGLRQVSLQRMKTYDNFKVHLD